MFNERKLVNSPHKAVLIGCGAVAGGYDEASSPAAILTHVKAYKSRPDVRLTAVADVFRDRARCFADRWGIERSYTDPSQMLNDEMPSMVSICTPDATHLDMLRSCLGCPSVKAVWCEKPLALSFPAAAEIVREYESRGIILAVNYQRRWDERYRHVHYLLAQRALGDIQKVVVFYSKGFNHNASHAVDLMLWWFGDFDGGHVMSSLTDYDPNDPTVDVLASFGGVPVYFIGTDERAYSFFEIQLIGTQGRIVIKRGGVMDHFQVQEDADFKGHRSLVLKETWSNVDQYPMAKALDSIVCALAQGESVSSDGRSALAVLGVSHMLGLTVESER